MQVIDALLSLCLQDSVSDSQQEHNLQPQQETCSWWNVKRRIVVRVSVCLIAQHARKIFYFKRWVS